MTSTMTLLKALLTTTIVATAAASAFAADIGAIGGSIDDTFWNKIKKGRDDATPGIVANGGPVNDLRLVNHDNFAPDLVQLIRTAISMDVDGLVIPDRVQEAEDPAIKDAMAAGIKVSLMNAGGGDKARELGTINDVANKEYPAGLAGGAYFTAHGTKTVMCVNTIPGAANLEARCKDIADAMTETGVKSFQRPQPLISFGIHTAVAGAIKAEVLKDETIDGVITISASDANSAAVRHRPATLSAGLSGGQLADLGHQLRHRSADFPVLTGPGNVAASNVEAMLVSVAKGAR